MDNKNNNVNNNNANSQNPVQSYGGAPEGAYNMGVGVDGSLNQNAYGGPGNGLRMENTLNQASENQSMNQNLPKGGKSSKKMLIMWVVIAVLAAAALGAGIWALVSQHQTESGDKQQESTEDKTEEKVEELSVDGELVQKLYKSYDTNGFIYTDEQMLNGEIPEEKMLIMARLNTEQDVCKGSETNLEVYGEELIRELNLDGMAKARTECYSGKKVLAKMEQMFGKTMKLEDGMRTGSFTAGGQPNYRYDESLDEFWYYIMPGGGMRPIPVHALYKAEKDEDHLYLYDIAGQSVDCALGNGEFGRVFGSVDLSYEDMVKTGYDESFGAEVSNMCREEYLVDYIDKEGNVDVAEFLKHKDDFAKFKWTFDKNADGEYVFAGLEKIEE